MKTIPLLLAGAMALHARTLHVTTTGNNTNSGTATQPWSLAKAVSSAVAGDTVLIHGGTYSTWLTPTKNGTTSTPILFKAAPGEKPVLNKVGILIQDRQNIKVSGIRVTNVLSVGIQVKGSQNVIIDSCSTYITQFGGFLGEESSNIKILNSKIERANEGSSNNPNCLAYSNPCKNAHEALSITETDQFEVAYNVLDGGWSEGIDTKGNASFGKVHHNEVMNTKLGIYTDAYAGNESDIEISSNKVHHNRNGGFILSAEVGGTLKRIKYSNNLIYSNEGPGFLISDWVSGQADHHIMEDITIVNNTSIGNGWGGGFMVANKEASRVIIRNNIAANNDESQVAVTAAGPGLVVENNLHFGSKSSKSVIGPTDIVADPKFVNAAAFDFHLQATSPALDRGLTIAEITSDLDGNKRPAGSALDLGAYERIVNGSSSVASSSSSLRQSSIAQSSSSIARSSSSIAQSSSSIARSSSSIARSSSSVAQSSMANSSSSVAGPTSTANSSSSTTTATLCANPILLQGSGTYNIPSLGACFKVNTSAYKFGAMLSVRNTTTSTERLEWYGNNDQNTTSCKLSSATLSGNGAQLNNFVAGKDASGFSWLKVIPNTGATSVYVDFQNWQNGSGCGVAAPPLAKPLAFGAQTDNPAPLTPSFDLLGRKTKSLP